MLMHCYTIGDNKTKSFAKIGDLTLKLNNKGIIKPMFEQVEAMRDHNNEDCVYGK